MDEIWKPVEGYEDLYEVSSIGRVRSLDRAVPHSLGGTHRAIRRGRILRPYLGNTGYFRVTLARNKKLKAFFIHRLVAIAFLDKRMVPQVNHKDCDKTNNSVENLEWSTRVENMQHAIKNGRLPKTMKPTANIWAITNPKKAKRLDITKVTEIRALHAQGTKRPQLAKQFGVTYATITRVVNRETWS